uniref:Uncharacterized protein n=1 Tax=Eutreptiella gymnastica TaxID=73025 RepID=A0A7S4GH10_9EUGL
MDVSTGPVSTCLSLANPWAVLGQGRGGMAYAGSAMGLQLSLCSRVAGTSKAFGLKEMPHVAHSFVFFREYSVNMYMVLLSLTPDQASYASQCSPGRVGAVPTLFCHAFVFPSHAMLPLRGMPHGAGS